MTKQNFLTLICAFLVHVNCFGAERTILATSGVKRVQLLELYSSESCSSCPPADAWVSELKDQSGLWKNFVPVVFHVDYWNNLGWTDEFSSHQMTQRQNEISKLWKSPKMYTPGMIVDGNEWAEWRDSKNHQLPVAPAPSGIELTLFKDSDNSYSVKASGLPKSRPHFIIRLAQLGLNLSTTVTSGENSGHVLKHNFIVLSWDSKPLDLKTREAHFKFSTPKRIPSRTAVVGWIETDGKPTALQAVGSYL